MNIKFYIYFILIALGVNLKSQAQVTYNKRAIGAIGTAPKIGDFASDASLENVDMATGTLNIKIPLYEIKVNDISVPITLTYSALGLKVGQEAGAPGMGWELNAGGKIVTNVQGRKDDLPGIGLENNPLPSDIYSNPNVFTPFSTHRQFTMDVIENKRDGAWDTYSYSFPGGGGTYVKNGLTFPYDPLVQIEHPWRIKTTDGLIYNFTSGDHKQSKRRSYYSPAGSIPMYIGDSTFTADPQTADWFDYDLLNIVSNRFKDTVSFSYESIMIANEPARLAAKTRVSTSESLPFYRNVRPASLNGGAIEDASAKFYKIGEPVISQSKTEYLAHTRITAIEFANGRVSFDYGQDLFGRDILITMRIYQKINGVAVTIKRYEFDYGSNGSDFLYGHYLKKIDVYDSKDQKVNFWAFSYLAPLPLRPDKPSNAQDRWGFYNGKTTNKTLLEHPDSVLALRVKNHYNISESQYATNSKKIFYTRPEAKVLYGISGGSNTYDGTLRYAIDFADRHFDFDMATKGILMSIKTPTGGKVSYAYEPHKFRDYYYVSGASTRLSLAGGGVRIKSITKSLENDSLYLNFPEGKFVERKFDYGEGAFSSSGSLTETNGYGNVTMPGNVLGHVSKYYDSSINNTTDFNNIMLLSHPINNMSQSGGSYGMYSVVSEYIKDVSGIGSFGKTVHYNRLPVYNDAPDWRWQISYMTWSLDDINIPRIYNNPGVQKELMIGNYGIKKYAYRSGAYVPIEETSYEFKSFSAPLNSQTKMLSFFCSMGATLSGPLPSNTSGAVVNDFPQPNDGSLYLYNQLGNSGSEGRLDYYSRCLLALENGTPNFQGKYAAEFVDLATLSNCIKKDKEQTMTFDDNGNTLSNNITKYFYDNPAHLLATRIGVVNSKGDSVITRTKYANDYSANPTGTIIDFMKSNKVSLSEPIEEYTTYKKNGTGTEYFKSGVVNVFKQEDNVVYNDKVFQMKVNNEITAYTPSTFTGAESSLDVNKYKAQISYDLYRKGNIHKYTELAASANVVIWGYGNQYPIAKVNNANNISFQNDPNGRYTSADVAYTSFESKDPGNWTYAGVPAADANSPSGKKVYSLATGPITKTNGTPNSVKYTLSYWYKNGAAVSVAGGTVTPAVIKNTWGDWSFAEREITAVSGVITVSGTGDIDELRFHPYDAQMTTYTYEPLIGLTGVIDAKGKLQYYEYDEEQRLKNIRDQDGNIVKSYKYQLYSGL